jgi:predicted nucleic acid-binding Zn ribbon protein
VRRSAPRPLAGALAEAARRAAPATTLARAQELWRAAAGETIARESEPVAEREGVLTVACASATWANELDLLAPDLLEALNATLRRAGHARAVTRLRLVTRTPARGPAGGARGA